MRIIKLGSPIKLSYKPARLLCNHCRSKLEVQKEDFGQVFDWEDQAYWRFACPVCNGENWYSTLPLIGKVEKNAH